MRRVRDAVRALGTDLAHRAAHDPVLGPHDVRHLVPGEVCPRVRGQRRRGDLRSGRDEVGDEVLVVICGARGVADSGVGGGRHGDVGNAEPAGERRCDLKRRDPSVAAPNRARGASADHRVHAVGVAPEQVTQVVHCPVLQPDDGLARALAFDLNAELGVEESDGDVRHRPAYRAGPASWRAGQHRAGLRRSVVARQSDAAGLQPVVVESLLDEARAGHH